MTHIENYRQQIAYRFQQVTNGGGIPKASTLTGAVKKETKRSIIPLKSFQERTRFDRVVVSDGNRSVYLVRLSFSYVVLAAIQQWISPTIGNLIGSSATV